MKPILLGLPLFFLALSAISWGVRKFKEFPFFKIQQVVVEGDVEIDISELIGQNIFDLNREDLKAKYEDEKAKLVKLRKLFPSKVLMELEERKPFAILQLRKTYEIDSDGVILRETYSKWKDMPVIRVSSARNLTELWELKSNHIMNIIHLFMKNFGGVKEISLYDDDLVIRSEKEIHLGQERWFERIEKLAYVNLEELSEYEVDLRFKNQIIVRR